MIDGVTDRVSATIPLGGEAGNTKYDAGSGCILVAVQTNNEIVAIDPATAAIVARYALARGNHPHGLYVDAPNRLLFVANQGNATMEVVDLRTMEVTDIEPVGDDPDVLAFDPDWAGSTSPPRAADSGSIGCATVGWWSKGCWTCRMPTRFPSIRSPTWSICHCRISAVGPP